MTSSPPTPNSAGLVLWQSSSSTDIAARIAITGAFSPAHIRGFSAADWRDRARPLFGLFHDIDTTFTNLESSIADEELVSSLPLGTHPAASAACLAYLASIRTNTVGLANNRSYDCGRKGLERTREAILRHGMIPIGAVTKPGDHPEIRIWHGPARIRVGFWAAAKTIGGSDKPGAVRTEAASLDRGLYALECMRRHGANFCVALLRAGSSPSSRPEPAEVRLMDSLAHWGFDAVAASHCHRVGGARLHDGFRERKTFCFYGLGNLLSGRAGSRRDSAGLVAVAGLNSRGEFVRMEVRPFVRDANGLGEVAAPAPREKILDCFRALSGEIADGSYEGLFYRDVARGLAKRCIRDVRAVYAASSFGVLARKARLMRAKKPLKLADKAG